LENIPLDFLLPGGEITNENDFDRIYRNQGAKRHEVQGLRKIASVELELQKLYLLREIASTVNFKIKSRLAGCLKFFQFRYDAERKKCFRVLELKNVCIKLFLENSNQQFLRFSFQLLLQEIRVKGVQIFFEKNIIIICKEKQNYYLFEFN